MHKIHFPVTCSWTPLSVDLTNPGCRLLLEPKEGKPQPLQWGYSSFHCQPHPLPGLLPSHFCSSPAFPHLHPKKPLGCPAVLPLLAEWSLLRGAEALCHECRPSIDVGAFTLLLPQVWVLSGKKTSHHHIYHNISQSL